MFALCVAVWTVQHDGRCEVNCGLNCGLRVVYRQCHCDWLDLVPDVPPVFCDSYLAAPVLDLVPDVPPVCTDSYLAANRRLQNFQCILWDISQFLTAN